MDGVRAYADVITKFFRIHRFSIFFSYGAPLACGSSATNLHLYHEARSGHVGLLVSPCPCVYAPNTVSDRNLFFNRLHTFFLSPGDLILGGDFNCIDSDLDRLHIKSDFSADKRCLSALKSDFCLVDVFRKQNPKAISFTWSNKDFSQASRLDRFYISSSLLQSVRGNKCFPCSLSDHDFVDLFISPVNVSLHGSGLWKFNCSLLSDNDFIDTMTLLITSEKEKIPLFDSLEGWWDNLKIQIRRACIDFSSRKRRQLLSERNSLTKRLLRAKSAVFAGDRGQITNVNKLESALEAVINNECEGAKVRSRARWIEEGEKPTRFFFRLERKRAEKNIFESLFNESGEEKFSHNDIELILVDFYKALFSKDSLNMQIQTQIIDDLDLSLSDLEREQCEGLFTKDELSAALKGLQTGKSPGSDGLPVEFYSVFWDLLCDPLLAVLNDCFRAGSLCASQREALLRLIYKKDDKRLAKNWRPISLLNCDYKLASKIITDRLKQVMPSIVHSDQTCSVINRSIFSNLHLIRDTLDMINKTDETGILVTLDQMKAFDRVDHDFLMRVLSKFGFGPSFCRWVSIFYSNVFSRIICNGKLSTPVFLERGVRQGCPLSPLLYVLTSEVLANQIRKNPAIEGFLLPGTGGLQFKISQYADDATNFVKNERSLCHLLETVNKYERGSGAKLNTSKSEAIWLGRWRANGASPFGLQWVNKLKILGVHFSNGLVNVDEDNWRCKLDKLKRTLGLWSQRDLSFLGRGMILNVLGASKFWHVAKVLPPPKWVSVEYKRAVWPFIWKSKSETVSRARCVAPIARGGLNIVDFETKCSSLRLSSLSGYREGFGTCKWHFLARYFFGNRFSNLDPSFDFSSRSIPLSSEPSAFYRNCLSLLSSLRSKHGSLPADFSCKNLYNLLLDVPSASPRSSGFWAASLKRPMNRWAAVWRKSRLKLIENKKTDLLWLIIHRAIKVRYALKTWGYKLKSDKCALCSQVETIDHCFLFCPRVRAVWNYFTPHLSRLSTSPFSVNSSCIFFPFSSRTSSPSFSLYCYLIATILFWIWQTRSLATFRNSVLNFNQIVNLIKKDVSCRILCAKQDEKENFWSTSNVLCKISDANSISFFPHCP